MGLSTPSANAEPTFAPKAPETAVAVSDINCSWICSGVRKPSGNSPKFLYASNFALS